MPDPKDYTVGWVCAIATEFVAAQAFLDEEHDRPDHVAQNDNNIYCLGKIRGHNVVIAVLPDWEYGTTSAATVARDMLHSFPNIRIGLMVGTGGGAPSPKHDIRLGDIVVSSPCGGHGGVLQYDFGDTIQNQAFKVTGFLNQPPTILRAAVNAIRAQHDRHGHQLNDDIHAALEGIKRKKKYSRPLAAADKLYQSDFIHPPSSTDACGETCGEDNLVPRAERDEEEDDPAIHYGLIASASQLMQDAQMRDKLVAEKGVACFEMEAAGLMNHFPCLVIRGICDYSDSHKNKEWQGFAAMAAAAYAKDLLRLIAPNKVEAESRIGEVLGAIDKGVQFTKTAVETIISDEHMESIEHWLRPPNPSTNANHARSLRHKGTGNWFLESDPFKEWKLGSRRHLCLHGLPGCGKTVLSATILDNLAQNDTILMYYFDFTDSTKRAVDGMARSLVSQLYTLDRHLALDSLFKTHRDGRDDPATKTLLDTLHVMLQSRKTSIVLDAMDECSTRSELLSWIQSLVFHSDVGNIQLIATCRPEEEFLSSIPVWIGEDNFLSLDKSSIDADIRSYITTRVQSQEFDIWTGVPGVQEQICEEVGRRADGMFRLAACQVDSLKTCIDRETIESTLMALPRDLDGMYNRILEQIPESLQKKAYRLLQFLIHSERPLTLAEAVDVVAVRIDSHPRCFDTKDRMPRPHQITRLCPSLVSIIPVSTREISPWLEQPEELHLAHFSVKEFLLKDSTFDIAKASIPMTITCLTYLSGAKLIEAKDTYLSRLNNTSLAVLQHIRDEIMEDLPFASLAASTWMDYARFAESSNGNGIVTIISEYLQDQSKFDAWTMLYQPDKPWSRLPNATKATCLYYTCLKGLGKTTRKILSQGADIKAKGGQYGNPLQVASVRGHREIVQLLLEKGADVNPTGSRFDSPLWGASSKGHYEIVQLLLEKGADINTTSDQYHGPLQAALGSRYHSPLQVASVRGHREIVQLLLEKGADVNPIGSRFDNPLRGASAGGYLEIVQLLLEKGADVNPIGSRFNSPLWEASAGGYLEIVQLLLEKGADVNATGDRYHSPLQAASSEGHYEIVQLLREKGACDRFNDQ